MTRFTRCLLALAVAVAASPGAAQEEEKKTGWASRAELSLVATGGNTQTETASLRGNVTRTWEDAQLRFEAGGLRTESTAELRTAVLSPAGDVTVFETSLTERTAENYFFRARYQRDLSERFFWFAGAGWSRNEFNGIRNRTSARAGVGNVWFDDDRARFSTDYGLTVTREEPVVFVPGEEEETFAGAYLSYLYDRQLTESTRFASQLDFDQNLDETSDYRADFTNSVSVAMSERLALRVALQLLYDADPSLEAVPLVTPDGEGTLLLPLDELDSVLTVALVIDF